MPLKPSLEAGESDIVLPGGRLRVRAIRPEDTEALVEMGQRSTPEDLRLRFFSTVRPRMGSLATMLTHLDPAKHWAIVAYDPEPDPGHDGFLGVVRVAVKPEANVGEFAIMVRSDYMGRGLGRCLIQEMLRWARRRGLAAVEGQVLRENARMLSFVQRCGAIIVSNPGGDYQTLRVAFDLRNAEPASTT